MKFAFARYTDVTKHAKKVSKDAGGAGEYQMYERILICPDTNDAWVAKILVGYNENYEKDEDMVLIERNLIDGMGSKYADINSFDYCDDVLILDIDDGGNWDVFECGSVEEALEILDDGYGIIEEGE